MEKPFGRKLRPDLAEGFHRELAKAEDAKEGPLAGIDFSQLLVRDAAAVGASDIHVEPHKLSTRVRFRIDGAVYDVATLTPMEAKFVINQFKGLAEVDPVVTFLPRDAHGRCELGEQTISLRFASAPSQAGEALAIRLLDPKRLERSIQRLGLGTSQLQLLEDWIENLNGMFLAAGPTGSGKTTTIYALLHELKFSDRIIVSLEDPVEYELDGIVQMEMDERHNLSFTEGVKAMLRMDPDFVMLGEIRDAVSAHSAVNAALSGRVLMSTLPARDAVGAITALRNWNLQDKEIAESLTCVVAQRLVRKVCTACRERMPTSDSAKRWLAALNLPVVENNWQGAGCAKCSNLGYAGRTGIFEIWRMHEEDYRLILEHADEHQLRRSLLERGHHSILTDGFARVTEGVTSVDELRRACTGCFPGQSHVDSRADIAEAVFAV